tara:strand:+ start:1411 stop:2178 length:768 start_codon:yes stop_codon:yes gene_type:complete
MKKYFKKQTHFYLFLSSIIFLSSCANKKNIVYFQQKIDNINSSSYLSESIQKNDILNINVSALDITSIAPFLENNSTTNNNADQRLIDGYKVNSEGEINLPIVGKIKVEGLTTSNAGKKIEDELSKKIINPVVNVTLLTYRITILGEVNNPGTLTLYNQKINLIQAIGLAGDMTIFGKRKKIKIIREKNGVSTKKIIDITKSDFFDSEYYYLKNNDIIYVEPSFAKVKNSGYIGQISNVATIFSLITSIILLSRN